MPRFFVRFFPLFPLMLTPDIRFQDYETRWNWPWYWKLLNRLEVWSWQRERRIYGQDEAGRRMLRKLRRMKYEPIQIEDWTDEALELIEQAKRSATRTSAHSPAPR